MPPKRNTRALPWLAGLLTVVGAAGATAQPPAAVEPPDLYLRYRELANREQFAFVSGERKFSKAVGDMSLEFPLGTFPTGGFDPALRTFCVEAFVPMYAGEIYPFRVDPVTKPAWYGLPDTPEGQAATDKRVRFVRELYGRFYNDLTNEPAPANPAFQVALWELIQETDVPDGPMPFSLFTGTFRADYPAEADAPAYVRQAQRYVQALTGDDAPFAANPALADRELVRLTALRPAFGPIGQSQFALRSTVPPANPGTDLAGSGSPAVGGGLGGIPTGFGGSGLRGGGPGLGGPALGGIGGGGGGLGGFGGVPVTTDAEAPRAGPAEGTTPTPVLPPIPTVPTDSGTSGGGPSVTPPQFPPTPQGPNPPGPNPPGPNNPNPPGPEAPIIPAPAGVVLGVIGTAALAVRRLRAG